jgi:transposase
MQGRHTAVIITLSAQERVALLALQRSYTARAGIVRRGHVILLVAEGYTITDVARCVHMSRKNVYKWCHRFLAERCVRLEDRSRRHHPHEGEDHE